MPDGSAGLTPDQFFGTSSASPPAAPQQPGAQPSGDAPSGLTPEQFFGGAPSAPASPAPASAPQTGLAKNIGAGLLEGSAGAINTAADPVGNLVGRPLGAMLIAANHYLAPKLGWREFSPEDRAEIMGQNDPDQIGTTATNAFARAAGAPTPAQVTPGNTGQELARAGAAGLAAGVPMGLAAGAGPVFSGLGSAAGGVVGEVASDSAPDAYKPAVSLLGNLLPAAGLSVAGAAVRPVAAALYDRGAGMVRPMVGKAAPVLDASGQPIPMGAVTGDSGDVAPVMAKPGQAQMAGARLLQSATDPQAAMGAIDNTQPLVPGSNPTTFQATQDPGLGQLERAAATKRPDLFIGRQGQQRDARAAYVQDSAGNGNPAAVGQLARSTLENIQAQGEAQTEAARQAAQGAVGQMGGAVPASTDGATALQSLGAALRDPLVAADQAAKANVTRLFKAFDPDGTAKFDMSAVRDGAKEIAQGIGPNAAPPAGEEGAILMRARLMPAVQSAKDFQDFYSRLGTAMRAARIDPSQAQAYGRLSQLMGFMHDSISDTVARAAASDPTIADRLETFSGGGAGQYAQPVAVGQSYGGASGETPGAQPAGAVGYDRTGGQAGGRSGSAAGYSGISKTARSAAPESLVSYLTRNGGVYDDGGDLASMGARSRVGFLRNRPASAVPDQGGFGLGGFNSGNSRAGEPMQLDYARQKAIEAGYLPPGSDLTDFKAAIGEDLRGNRQYVPEDYAAHQSAIGFGPSAGRQEAAMDAARGDVEDAAAHLNGSLHPDEAEHAARLVVMGVDPHDAIEQATNATVQADLSRPIFTGDRGMPDTARQAGMGVEPPLPPGSAFMSREAADNLAAARAAHKARIETYQRAPGVGGVLARGPTAGTFKMSTSAVPSAIWSGGKGAAEKVSAFLRAGGDPEALQNYAAFDLRKAALRSDGTLDPGKLDTWQAKHSEELQAFPALRQKFSTAAAATRAMDDAAADAVAAQKAHQASALGRFIGDADPERTVGRILGADDASARMAELVDQVKGDPAALAGLRHAVMARYLPMVAGDSFKAFPKALTKEWLGVSKVLAPDQLKVLRDTQTDLARSETSGLGTKLQGQSNTPQDTHGAGAHGVGGHGNMLSQILAATVLEGAGELFAHAAGAASFTGSAIRLGTTVAGAMANAMRQNGVRQVDDLVAYAALHPPLAKALMAQAIKTPKDGNLAILRHQLGAAALAAGASTGRNVPATIDQRAPALPAAPRVSVGMLN